MACSRNQTAKHSYYQWIVQHFLGRTNGKPPAALSSSFEGKGRKEKRNPSNPLKLPARKPSLERVPLRMGGLEWCLAEKTPPQTNDGASPSAGNVVTFQPSRRSTLPIKIQNIRASCVCVCVCACVSDKQNTFALLRCLSLSLDCVCVSLPLFATVQEKRGWENTKTFLDGGVLSKLFRSWSKCFPLPEPCVLVQLTAKEYLLFVAN